MRYVLDSNVLKKISGDERNANVDKWLATVNDIDLYITVFTVMESQKGIELLKKSKNPIKAKLAMEIERGFEEFLADWEERILQLDVNAAREWGRRLAKHGAKNAYDLGIISIISKQNNAVAVSRNLIDFRHRGITVIDPFEDPAAQYSDPET